MWYFVKSFHYQHFFNKLSPLLAVIHTMQIKFIVITITATAGSDAAVLSIVPMLSI